MSDREATKLLNSLLKKKPVQVQVWLKSIWTKEQQVSEEFNWLGLAEVAASLARENLAFKDNLFALEWAKIATSVYEFLAESNSNTFAKNSFTQSSMLLRSNMIFKLGNLLDDPVLDAEEIVNWFFKELKFSYKEAIQKSSLWRELSPEKYEELAKNEKQLELALEEIRDLREIKNRLAVIRVLTQNELFKPNEEIKAWNALWEKLP